MKPLIASLGYATGSLVLHLALVQGSGGAAVPARASRPPATVRLSVAPPPAPEPPAPPAKPVSKPAEARRPKRAPAAAPPEPVAPEPSDPAPAELTGTTLVGTGAAAWSAPAGTGGERDGAIGAGLSRSQAAKPIAAVTAVVAPAAVSLAQLSRKPVPPPLAEALQRNYPERARQQGQSGDAKVRARIEPSGVVRSVDISYETAAGFGDACRRTLLASRWSAPLNEAGRPVATWITYRCKFRVDD